MPIEKPFNDEDVAYRVEVVQTKDNKVYVAYPAGKDGLMDPVVTLKLIGAGTKILGDTLQKQLQAFAAKAMGTPAIPGLQVVQPDGIEAPDPGQGRIIVPRLVVP